MNVTTCSALSVREARKRLGGISNAVFYRLINEEQLRSFKIGRRRLISEDAIREFIRAREELTTVTPDA